MNSLLWRILLIIRRIRYANCPECAAHRVHSTENHYA